MKSNPYTGDVPLLLPGWPAYVLRFDWAAIATMQAEFGDEALKIVAGRDVKALLGLAAIGLQRHHPGITAEDLGDADRHPTAIAPLTVKVGEALALAYNGPGDDKVRDSAGKDGEPNPPRRATPSAIARLLKRLTRFGRR